MKTKTAIAAAPEPKSKCPNCGYCPHCGRDDRTTFIPYPVHPAPTPWYIPYQQPQWTYTSTSAPTSTGTMTVAGNPTNTVVTNAYALWAGKPHG